MSRLSHCDICPRKCGINRLEGEKGFCRTGRDPIVSSFCAHMGEEPPISGVHGAGTIFFGYCNLNCVFCQNYQISQPEKDLQEHEVSIEQLADMMIELQEKGCHNIDLVTPSHCVPQIVSALDLAAERGLTIPIVYNTNAYDSLETLRELDGVIDIYLPDLKYSSEKNAVTYSKAPNYPMTAKKAIKEMWKQAGPLETDKDGIAIKGIIIRHLLLPNFVDGPKECLNWISDEISMFVHVSLMSQYYPEFKAFDHPEIARTLTEKEYKKALNILSDAGLSEGWNQDLNSSATYRPDFTQSGHPFE
ncbi:MAG: radical SAM protein [Dehalococcoidales bacterium]|nr:radical SAM protein [Dehalococcoidales bacterium]